MHPLTYPVICWSRVHEHFAVKDENVFLVLVYAYSNWVEVWPMTFATASKTIEKMRGVLAAYGLPETLACDNRPQFTSAKFADFLSANGVKHARIPPIMPHRTGRQNAWSRLSSELC